jgi:hypothetical protein
MSSLRITAPLLTAAVTASLAAALGVTGLTTASATAAPGLTPGDSCLLRAQTVRVKDVQDDASGTDDAVFVRLGNSSTITRSYTVPQTRNTLGDGRELFAETAQVTLFVDDGGVLMPVGSTDVPCETRTHKLVFDNGDARYKVKALVQVQP